MGNLTELLSKIQPAVYQETITTELDKRNSNNVSFVENVANLNIRRSVNAIISRSYILEHLVEQGEIAIIGAKHLLETGEVVFLEDTWISNKNEVIAQTQ